MRRRTLLGRGATIATLGLAGCAMGTDGDATADQDGADSVGSPTATDPSGPSPTASPTSAATGTPTDAPTETPTNSPTTDTPDPDQTVVVAPDGELIFAPRSFEIAAGETVRWVWEAGGHNVVPSAMPDGADWPGTAGGDSRTFGAGHTYLYTFEAVGTYEYYCAPHRFAGMTGSFDVE